MAHHKAQLIIRDDQRNSIEDRTVMYAIYKRSQNRILQIVKKAEAVPMQIAA